MAPGQVPLQAPLQAVQATTPQTVDPGQVYPRYYLTIDQREVLRTAWEANNCPKEEDYVFFSACFGWSRQFTQRKFREMRAKKKTTITTTENKIFVMKYYRMIVK